MKRLLTMVLALMLCLSLAAQVSAADLPRLVDSADLLTDAQEAELLAHLDELSEAVQADIVIVTLESLGGYSADDVVNAFYDQYNYGMGPGRDGVVLLLSMAERDWRILSNGFAADAITMGDIDSIGSRIVDDLSDGEYMDAFVDFADLCAYEIDGERNGFPFRFGMNLAISLAIGFAVAFIATGVMRSKLKSVRSQTGAQEYTRPGSFQLTRSSDLFLYRTLDRRRRPQNNGSSGRSGGGGGSRNVGGGKF